MPVPVGVEPNLSAYLQELEGRVALLETPQGCGPAFLTVSTKLTTISAAQSAHRWGIATDLKTVVWSDGVHFYRADTGATIV